MYEMYCFASDYLSTPFVAVQSASFASSAISKSGMWQSFSTCDFALLPWRTMLPKISLQLSRSTAPSEGLTQTTRFRLGIPALGEVELVSQRLYYLRYKKVRYIPKVDRVKRFAGGM